MHRPLAVVLLLASAALAQTPPAQALYFVMNDQGTTADFGAVAGQPSSALGQLYDTTIARFVPGEDASAARFTGLAEWATLLGDVDADYDFWESVFDSVDALSFDVLNPLPARPTSADLILSCETAFGGALEDVAVDAKGACDGTLFSLRRQPDGSDVLVVPFLPELMVLKAIGQLSGPSSDGVDVDAFALDAQGNVYLSFRVDETVNGTLLADDGVVALPGLSLSYDSSYTVVDAYPGSAVIVLDAAAVNALVAHAGLKSASGAAIQSLTDLQALEIDPAGGSFTPVQASSELPLVPNLLFAGQAIGPTVLTTADAGRIATLNGQVLGTPTLSGAALGLDPVSTSGATSDLNALALLDAVPPCALLDVASGEVDVHVTGAALEFLAGGLTPLAPALVLVDVAVPFGADAFPSVPVAPGLVYPDYFLTSPPLIVPLLSDASGRLRLPLLVGPPPPIAFAVLAQAADLVRKELSSPAVIWCP